MSRLLFFAYLLAGSLSANNVLFMANQGRHEEAAKLIREERPPNAELIEGVALNILKEGLDSSDKETSILSLFGASVALNEKAEAMVERGWKSPDPEIQLATLMTLAKSKSDRSLYYLNQALSSPYILMRLEAAFLLAERKCPDATDKIESLMSKCPPQVHYLFPQLFALVGDEASKRCLRRLLTHSDEKARTEAILAIAKTKRDDLSKEIRWALSHPDARSKEAASIAIMNLKDESALPDLERLKKHPSPHVRVAVFKALRALNRKEAIEPLIEIAQTGDIFAIAALSSVPEAKEALVQLLNHSDRAVRINAAAALLELNDDRAIARVGEILIKDPKDISYIPVTTPSGALTAIKPVPSARQNLKEEPMLLELSLKQREQILEKTLKLSDGAFFRVAEEVLKRRQNDLVPTLMTLLESKGSQSLPLLRQAEQMIGAPLIRNWAALTLFKLKEPGYREKLKSWLKAEASIDLIKFRPFVPWEKREGSPYELSPNEKAGLWVMILEGLIQQDPEDAVDFLLELIAQGSGKNRYVFAGLLLRSIQ